MLSRAEKEFQTGACSSSTSSLPWDEVVKESIFVVSCNLNCEEFGSREILTLTKGQTVRHFLLLSNKFWHHVIGPAQDQLDPFLMVVIVQLTSQSWAFSTVCIQEHIRIMVWMLRLTAQSPFWGTSLRAWRKQKLLVRLGWAALDTYSPRQLDCPCHSHSSSPDFQISEFSSVLPI